MSTSSDGYLINLRWATGLIAEDDTRIVLYPYFRYYEQTVIGIESIPPDLNLVMVF